MVNCDYSQGSGFLFATNPAEESTKTTSQSSNTEADATGTSTGESNSDDDNNGDDGDDGGKKKKKTNVGAIAGGVVGGLGAAALIGVAIMLFIRRNKAKKANEQPTGDKPAPGTSAPSTPGHMHGNMQQWSPPPQQQQQQAYAYPPPQQGYPTPPPNGQYDAQAIPAAYHPGQTPSPQGFDSKMSPGAFHPGQTPSPQGYDPRSTYMGQSPPPQQPSPYSPHSPSTGYGYPASVSAAGVTHDGASQMHGTPHAAPIELAGHEAAAHSVPVELGAENPHK